MMSFSAFISARGAKMDEEIDQNFMEVLEEEGYRVEEVTKHARRNK
jgi:lipocalin